MTAGTKNLAALRLRLDSGPCSIPLHRVHHLTGFATLTGTPDDYFLGWLTYHGQQVPVFDLNRVVCDQPTPERFGSRIILLPIGPHASAGMTGKFIGLLAGDLVDTIAMSDPEANPLDLDGFLPMLYTLIPSPPGDSV
jgi:chemotaxis signal transduction protein